MDEAKKAEFLAELGRLKFLRKAARAVGVTPQTIYNQCKSDPIFGAAVDDIFQDGNEQMEEALFTRAVHGVRRPVVQGGKVVKEKDSNGVELPVVITTYSDDLLKFALMGRMPEKYGTKIKVDANIRQTGVMVAPSPRDARDIELRLAGLEKARREGKVIDVEVDLPEVMGDESEIMIVEDERGYEAPPVRVDENGTPRNGHGGAL